MYISDIILREILDSRGKITVEAEVWTDEGTYGRAAAPSGASTGGHEVVAFPRGDPSLGIKFFMENVLDDLLGISVFDQDIIDAILHEKDSTENFSGLLRLTVIGIIPISNSFMAIFTGSSFSLISLTSIKGGAPAES